MKRWVKSELMARASVISSRSITTKLKQSNGAVILVVVFH